MVETSILSTTLPRTTANGSGLRLLRERVVLLLAIVASYQVLWLGTCPAFTRWHVPFSAYNYIQQEKQRKKTNQKRKAFWLVIYIIAEATATAGGVNAGRIFSRATNESMYFCIYAVSTLTP